MLSRPIFVTTAIAYVNAAPHIGFAMECIEADAVARYHRLIGDDTWFLTGTDEHGIKIQKTAQELGITPKELSDMNAAKCQDLKQLLNLSNDDFIRTSDQKRHWPAVIKLWNKLKEQGDIYKADYEALYCSGCEAFILEKDLVDGLCPDHKRAPEMVKEENYFFRLSKYSDQIMDLIESKKLEIIPHFRANEILSMCKEGLQDVSFSRSKKTLTWGIPVPDDPAQVMYVWCDALTNYISAIGYAEESEQFQKFWPHVTHVIGKDIVRFHAAIWPGMLIAAGIPTPEKILIHGFITSEGQKMSKSLGNVVEPTAIVEEFGVDAVRYYLLSEIPVGKDGDFSLKLFKERYTAHLGNNLGNLVNRVIMMSKRYAVEVDCSKLEAGECQSFIENLWSKYQSAMEARLLHEGVQLAWSAVSYANKYIDDNEPWKLVKENPEAAELVLMNLLEVTRHIALMISPFIPQTAEKIFKQLNITRGLPFEQEKSWGGQQDWKGLGEAEILFPKLEEEG